MLHQHCCLHARLELLLLGRLGLSGHAASGLGFRGSGFKGWGIGFRV